MQNNKSTIALSVLAFLVSLILVTISALFISVPIIVFYIGFIGVVVSMLSFFVELFNC